MPVKGIAYFEAQLKIADDMTAVKVEAVKLLAENKISIITKKNEEYKKYLEYHIKLLKEKSLDL